MTVCRSRKPSARAKFEDLLALLNTEEYVTWQLMNRNVLGNPGFASAGTPDFVLWKRKDGSNGRCDLQSSREVTFRRLFGFPFSFMYKYHRSTSYTTMSRCDNVSTVSTLSHPVLSDPCSLSLTTAEFSTPLSRILVNTHIPTR